jgi:8-amino-7-oxononanoate synthase
VTDSNKFSFVDQRLAQRTQAYQLRQMKPFEPKGVVEGWRGDRHLINFSANDYLGLSKHPALIAAAQNYTQRYGTGAPASRLVTGTYPIHQHLEHQLADACGREAALLFSSGFQANSTLLPTLVDASSVVLCDRLIHNSLLQGILASRARFMRYWHNDLAHLRSLLDQVSQQTFNRILIVSETVFSMDGDRCEVDALVQLAQTYNAILYLDDAHALGVLGQGGMGLATQNAGVDLVVGTFGKAFGAFGAFVVCSQKLRDYFVNYCPGLIYTTALPPAVIGTVTKALELMPSLEAERYRLSQHTEKLRLHLQQMGYATGNSHSQIVPLILGSEEKTLHLSQWLEDHGILATAIRPPTVERGTARIRFALSSQHTETHLNLLIKTLYEWHEQPS